MPENITTKLLLGFITLLIGVVLIGTLASEGLDKTDKNVITDESISIAGAYANTTIPVNHGQTFTVTNNPTTWKITDCPLTSVVLTNSSGTVFTDGTDYDIDETTGIFNLYDTVKVNITFIDGDNLTYVDYTYCGDDYMNLSWGRTGINLVAGFFALGLLIASVGLFYSAAKDTGMI